MYRNYLKRILDIFFALLIAMALSWLILIIIILYVIQRDSNIFFAQQRIGYKEKSFRLYKFRTLKKNESLPKEQRQFVMGRFLRATSLDELPQLWNILRGEMSFVGPRPLLVEYLPLYSDQQRARHTVRPGMTGWAQINGRHSISWQEKFQLDLFYVEHLTFWLDMRIFFKTLLQLFSLRKDISLHEEKFSGNA